jgi:hypothetical protein
LPNHVQHWHGTGHATNDEGGLLKAIEEAWEDVKKNDPNAPAGTYVVERIELDCENPINSYTVIIVSA